MIDKISVEKFIKWAKLKLRIHIVSEIDFYFREREVWWCSLGVNIGHEQDGKNEKFERPMLILKKFNKHIFWGVPLTSQQKSGKYYHKTYYQEHCYCVILSQLRLVSSKRLTRKVRTLAAEEFEEIKVCIKQLL